jgi:hypothetical protein
MSNRPSGSSVTCRNSAVQPTSKTWSAVTGSASAGWPISPSGDVRTSTPRRSVTTPNSCGPSCGLATSSRTSVR